MTLPGHPDTVCDLVAEAVVDEYVRRDPGTRIRLAVNGGHGALFVSGDVKSKADFDVSALVRRTVASLGVLDELEPFVSIEASDAEDASRIVVGQDGPVTVTGYATSETPEFVPATVALARRIAKELDERRRTDQDWFWLGPDGDVTTSAGRTEPDAVFLQIEHGSKPLADARTDIQKLVRHIAPGCSVRVNESGPTDVRGLARRMGGGGRRTSPYGSAIPFGVGVVGMDLRSPEKAGAWLVRASARSLVASGAKAALVQATYLPGDRVPSLVVARDERGTDLTAKVPRESLALDRVMAEWWRPNLCADAARWGFAGVAGLPWEA